MTVVTRQSRLNQAGCEIRSRCRDMNTFQCCICGSSNPEPAEKHREMMFCGQCGSNARFRGLALGMMRHVLKSQASVLADSQARYGLVGVGLSDSEVYASIISSKFSYTNTFYHRDPHLDICDAESVAKYAQLDFIICSDVIEHTMKRPQEVLRNMFSMLKQGGVAIVSAPTYYIDHTLEWYPDADTIEVRKIENEYQVFWNNKFGKSYVHLNPVFHGGPGSTLELRVIAHNDLLRAGKAEGFTVETLEFEPQFGYYWPIVPQYPGVNAQMDGRIIVFRKSAGT